MRGIINNLSLMTLERYENLKMIKLVVLLKDKWVGDYKPLHCMVDEN